MAIEFNADRNITRDRFSKPRIYQSGMVSRFPRRYLNSAEIYTSYTSRAGKERKKNDDIFRDAGISTPLNPYRTRKQREN